MRQAVAGITANRDEMSSSEYQHSSSTTTSGNLEEVFLEHPPSVLPHLPFSRTLQHSKPCFSGRDVPSLFSLTASGGPASRPDLLRILQPILSASGQLRAMEKLKLPWMYVPPPKLQIRSPSLPA
jgi:hypothetical protein